MPLNITSQNNALTGGVGNAITHIGVHTLVDPGTTATANAGEATGGSPAYARQAVAWSAVASGQRSNSGALTFDVPAGTYGFLTYWNASTGNSGTQYLGYGPFASTAVYGFASTDPTLTNDQFFSVAHGLANGDQVQLFNVFAETIPTGITEGTVYFVVNTATNTFKVSTTSGGAAVDITALAGGEVFYQKVVPEVFGGQGQITVAIGAIVLDARGI